jgi:uncharacterized membrane protein SpoIIM required for sporulation
VLKEFIDARTRLWRRLEELVDAAQRNRLSRLSRGEVREFARLYRRTAADLAIAREEVADPLLVNYLNGLVGRAHGAIYRNEGSGFSTVLDFFRFTFPAVFRRTFAYTLGAFLLVLVASGIGAAVALADERFADVVAPGIRGKIVRHEDWTLAINGMNPVASAAIQQNNIMVCILAFAGGLLFGVGTVYILVSNGLMIGAIVALSVRYGFNAILFFMAGHGVLELTAIFISGGAGFLLAEALVAPRELSRGDALVVNGRLAVTLMLGCACMLVIAGVIEGFVSPAQIDFRWKLAVSATTAVLLTLYLLKPDRGPAGAGA